LSGSRLETHICVLVGRAKRTTTTAGGSSPSANGRASALPVVANCNYDSERSRLENEVKKSDVWLTLAGELLAAEEERAAVRKQTAREENSRTAEARRYVGEQKGHDAKAPAPAISRPPIGGERDPVVAARRAEPRSMLRSNKRVESEDVCKRWDARNLELPEPWQERLQNLAAGYCGPSHEKECEETHFD
jgi:hypothetical protein